MNGKEYRRRWRLHNRAFRVIEFKLKGYNSIKGICHDLDKYILSFVFKEDSIRKFHRKWSSHHLESNNKRKTNFYNAIIDWECARFTKKDKQLDARETFEKYYKEYHKDISPKLEEFGL